ncbi:MULTISPECIES: hypothetical protein [unclassified Duganella]|uniref:hypothetical protein n=1 Tax=unclassified Duganella TaxID=2636909 RepID=UPI000B7DF83C|nr:MULTISPECIES: hypothetical protein [unclassified Duganella]
MPTLSFDFQFAPDPDELVPPKDGYLVTLHGDAGELTRFEIDCIANRTPAAYLMVRRRAKSKVMTIEIPGESHQLADLRANHYTWSAERSDGKPMGLAEFQLALMSWTKHRANQQEPAYTIPLSSLNKLLSIDKAVSGALIDVLANAEPMQREVFIADPDIAAKLVDLGLVTASAEPDLYALMNIKVH